MILSVNKQVEMYRRTFSRLVALARKYPDAKISDIVKVSFNELTGATGLELKEPVDKEVDETEIKANMDV
jgi:hypothetical protein